MKKKLHTMNSDNPRYTGLFTCFLWILLGILAGGVLSPPGLLAQTPGSGDEISVSGKVTSSEDGSEVPGVNIVVKGTTLGTISDVQGQYAIDVPNQDAVLIFSSVGFVTEEIPVGTQTTIDLTMSTDLETLSEVVVVGYGVQKKSDLTGAISSIPTEEIQQFPIPRVDQALQGRTPGVYVLNTDGAPGGNTMIRIRGLNSINGGNQPLVVIDGLQGGDLNALNPNDIASIEILKDASATAIYGSRGANGVVLVTTKLGKEGKPVVEAGYNIGFQELARKLPVMDAATFARTFNRYRMSQTGGGNVPQPQFTEAEIAEFERTGGTDWQDVVYQTGVLQNYQLGVSGGSSKVKYLLSSNYVDHEGILKGSGYTRISLRTNLSANITDWVSMGLNYAYTKETYKSPAFGSEVAFVSQVVNNAPRWAPTEPVYDDQGNYWIHRPGYGANDTWNPLASAVEPLMDRPTFTNNANLYVDFNIAEGLSLKITGGALIRNAAHRDYYNRKTLPGLQQDGTGTVNSSTFERFQNSNILTYDKTWNDRHHLTFTGVVEQIYEESIGSSIVGNGFLVDELAFDNLAGAQSVVTTSFHNERSLLSYMGRLNYVLNEKYLATFTYRADASSVFGDENKWGYFPSASLAWRLSEENFIKDIPLITELKLRGSYGLTGNQGISPYQSLPRLSSTGLFRYPYNGGVTTDTGFGIGGLANPGLRWETTTQSNIGLDVSLFEGRLTSTIDVYKKVTKDLLMPRELPGYVGVSSIIDNVGSIENKGIEILLGGNPIVGDFEWYTSLNFTANRNKVLNLGPDDRIGFTPSTGGYSLGSEFMFLQVGESFGLMNGWEYLGVWKTEEEDEARSYGQLPGDARYLDVDQDGDVDEDDRVTIGNGYPMATWGWNNQFSYKGWGLSLFFMAFQDVDLFNTMRIRRETFWEGTSPELLNAWTPENQDSDIPGIIDGKYREEQNLTNTYFFGNSSGTTSRWVEDASFFRLKQATLAYSFTNSSLGPVEFRKVRLFASGTNLFTITNYSGYDPEVAAFPNNDATIGVDLSAYPPAKTYTVGVELSF